MYEVKKGELTFKVYRDRAELGSAAAEEIGNKIISLLNTKELVSIIFASAPSQNEFLAELAGKAIDWSRVVAFHMDEYIGLEKDAPQSFGYFLKESLFSKVPVGQVHYMDGSSGDPEAECARYAALLAQYPPDLVCLGIGENTHLAFNDPHVADFEDPLVVKIVDLAEDCRLQQINDGCFPTLEEVPTHAITITIPELFKVPYPYAIVPGSFKANAIHHTAYSEISENYPSTILRNHPDAIVFIDTDSAARL
jgi:glucosamine-6-phosphate deaminase